jgi:hypothetical protein
VVETYSDVPRCTIHVHILRLTNTYYNCLTEDNPSGSKHLHAEDMAKINLKFSLTNLQFVNLHYMIILQCTV